MTVTSKCGTLCQSGYRAMLKARSVGQPLIWQAQYMNHVTFSGHQNYMHNQPIKYIPHRSYSCVLSSRTIRSHLVPVAPLLEKRFRYRALLTCTAYADTSPRFFSSQKTLILSMKEGPLKEFLESLEQEYNAIHERVQSADTEAITGSLSHRLQELTPLVEILRQYKEKLRQCEETKKLIQSLQEDESDSEPHVTLQHLAQEETELLQQELQHLDSDIIASLVPEEKGDNFNVILELTAGVGGKEAMLFTSEMLDMYTNYAAYKRWSFDTVVLEESELGGVRKATAMINGSSVYKYLKYEGGVHRVQRVPRTEKSGRIHTSTMTVAVLPQPTEIEVKLNPRDLRVDTFRASGAGGQHVNKTDSAVRVVHIPTGLMAECQAHRSQIKNKEMAMNIVRSRLFEMELANQTSDIQKRRKLQVGTAGRSEKIRTYNYNQDRVTDHRLGLNQHNLAAFLWGNEELDSFVKQLLQASAQERLLEVLKEQKSKDSGDKKTVRKSKQKEKSANKERKVAAARQKASES